MALVPAARWYWKDDSSPPKFQPYDAEQSAQLEAAFQNGAVEAVFFGNKYKINFPARRQTNVHTGFSRPVIRGTWFWRGDNGTFVPYPENAANSLERAFNAGQFINFQIQVDAERYVMLSPDNRHFQFRFNAPGRNGRQVLRGHNGQLVPASAQVAAPVVEVAQPPIPVMPVAMPTATVAPIATGQPLGQPAMGTPIGAQPAMGTPFASQPAMGAPAMAPNAHQGHYNTMAPAYSQPPSAFAPPMSNPSIVTPGPGQYGLSDYSRSTPSPTVNPQMTYLPQPSMSQPNLSPAPSPHTERRLSGGFYDMPRPQSPYPQSGQTQFGQPQPGPNQFGQPQLGQNQFGQVDHLQSQMSQLNLGQPSQSQFAQPHQFNQSQAQPQTHVQQNQFGQPQTQGTPSQIPPTGFPPGFAPQGSSQPSTSPSSPGAQPIAQYSGSSSYGASSTTQISQNISSTTLTTTTTTPVSAPSGQQIPPSGFPPGFGPSASSPSGQGYPPSTSTPQTAPARPSASPSSMGGPPSDPSQLPSGYPPGFNPSQ